MLGIENVALDISTYIFWPVVLSKPLVFFHFVDESSALNEKKKENFLNMECEGTFYSLKGCSLTISILLPPWPVITQMISWNHVRIVAPYVMN